MVSGAAGYQGRNVRRRHASTQPSNPSSDLCLQLNDGAGGHPQGDNGQRHFGGIYWSSHGGVVGAEQPTSDAVIDEMVSKVDALITEEIKERLRELMKKYSIVISLHELDLGWTDLVTHTIDTGDARPIRQQFRSHPPAHQVEIDKHVSDLLAQKVIEPAASPWSSNVVLAKQADRSWRYYIDFRQHNDVTRRDT